jgi:hypothetical protein
LTEDCITHGILSDDPKIVMMRNMFPAMPTVKLLSSEVDSGSGARVVIFFQIDRNPGKF